MDKTASLPRERVFAMHQSAPTRRASRYLTTAIPYVNAAPHIGFALEMVQADALARFYRQAGYDVRFQAGTDENSLKNVQAAEAEGVPVVELVARNAARFQALKQALELSVDDFIRTSTDPRHRVGAERLWAACAASGDLYRRAYRGLYCVGCEQFYTPADLEDGRCPEHGTVPDEVAEENWFFRLSRYAEPLRRLVESGALAIVPASRRNEVLAWIDAGLEDFSISRSAARARGWGIPVPGDTDQVIYVWFDALANYVTALGYGSEGRGEARFWTGALSREHVIGKGITRFHAVYWPAMLLSAGLPLPTRIFVHGYVTVEGRKIGKSAGNAVDPLPLAAEYGVDPLRYYLLRHIAPTGDGDFSVARLEQAYTAELAGQLGNLVHRVLSMIERYCGGIVPAPTPGFDCDGPLLPAAGRLPETVARHLADYGFDRALAEIWGFIHIANAAVAENRPWELAKAPGEAARNRLESCLYSLAVGLRTIADCLAPLLPSTSAAILAKLGFTTTGQVTPHHIAGHRVCAGPVLFPPRDVRQGAAPSAPHDVAPP